VCRDADEVETVMQHVGEEARAKGLDIAVVCYFFFPAYFFGESFVFWQGFLCAEYRVHTLPPTPYPLPPKPLTPDPYLLNP